MNKFINENLTVIVGVVAVVVVYYLFINKTEKMTNVSIEQQQVINDIYKYIVNNPNVNFPDYIEFLLSIKNTNLNIIDNEVFVTFKLLQKKKMFSITDIISAMKL
jgi:hypothetical protein